MRLRLLTALAAVLAGSLALGTTPSASAAWAVKSAPAPAAAAALAIPAPLKPSVTGVNVFLAATYTITWPTVTMTNGQPVTGYLVTRTTPGGGGNVLAGGSCAGTNLLGLGALQAVPNVLGLRQSCTENALLSAGTPTYQVTPLYGTWRGAPSPAGTL